MKHKGMKILTASLAALSLFTLSACSSDSPDSGAAAPAADSPVSDSEAPDSSAADSEAADAPAANSEAIALTIWGGADDQKMLGDMAAAFQTQNADKTYQIAVKVVDEAGTREEVLKDVEQAADVFCIPHDQLGALVEAGSVYENTKYMDYITSGCIEGAASASTYNGKIYGYPVSADTYYLTYDNTIFTEDDVKSLNTMLGKDTGNAAGKFGYEFDSAFYGSAFFFANGGELFGPDGIDDTKVNYNDASGLEVAKFVSTLKNQGALNIKADIASSQFTEGTLGAFVSGPWKANLFKENLGERYSVAKLPAVDFGSGEKQMISFAGYKMFCVNSFTKYPEEAMALAAFLSSPENQMKRFQDRNYLPVDKELSQNADITSDPTIKAVMEQLIYSRPTPALPQMSKYWNPMAAFMRDTYDGVIAGDQLQGALDNLTTDIITK